MTLAGLPSAGARACERGWVLIARQRGIVFAIGWNIVLLAGCLAALPFDARHILGLNPWIKPIKFQISVLVFLGTMGLLLGIVSAGGRWYRSRAWMGWGFGIAMIVENTIIALQSARGVPSHMNYTSVFNGVLFGIMGLFIALNTALLALLLVLFCVTRLERSRAEIWGIRLGLLMVLVASLEGVRIVMYGAHTVGAGDGGPGLPFLNWSTRYGDLRVPHFFAIHAQQVLWTVGWWFGRSRLRPSVAVAATWIFSLIYAVGVWLLFAQAMNAHPLLAMR